MNLSSSSRSITRIEGPPGSGKSRMLAREAVRLSVQDGVEPSEMILLAMSAANQKRLSRYLRQEAKGAGLGEFSAAVKMLDTWLLSLLNRDAGGQEPWVLLTEVETRLVVMELLQTRLSETDLWYRAAQGSALAALATDFIRQCQLQGVSPREVGTNAPSSGRPALLAGVYEAFEQATERSRLVTYPQLIGKARHLPEQALSGLPKVILLDEAQELSSAHYEFFRRLSVHLVLAGNEKLSIRSYRGANPELFQSAFQDAPTTILVQQAAMRNNTAILTLLNGFLPQPVWEEQSPDLEQLKQMVRFGYYDDPEQEALALADQMIAFVGNQFVGSPQSESDSCVAQWEDCVVLLRSARYKPHLIHAFTQRNIPFFDAMLSDEALEIQRGLFDLLQIFIGWERIQLEPGHFGDSGRLSRYWDGVSLSVAEREAFIQGNNWHLTRWLEACLQGETQSAALGELRQTQAETRVWALPGWLDPYQTTPAIREAIGQLLALYGNWLTEQSPVLLMAQAVTRLLPEQPPLESSEERPLPASFQGFHDALAQLAERYQRATGKPISLSQLLAHYVALWEAEPTAASGKPAGVRLRSIPQVQGEAFAWVAIPFLVGEEFPYRREMPELLTPEDWQSLGVAEFASINESEERRLLAVGMSRATQQLVLTAHRREDSASAASDMDTVLPSSFYVALLAEKRRLLGNPSPVLVCECHTKPTSATACDIQHGASDMALNPDADVQTESPFARYIGKSAWADLEAQEAEPVFDADAVLTTSPTAISTYMKCPRQYYYRHLLGLPSKGTVSASLGTLVHKVMELFNSQTQPGEYTVERLTDLAEALFCFETEPNRFHLAGYGERERRELTEMSRLAVDALRVRLLASIADLKDKGYFDRYGTMKAVYAERELREVEIDGIARCRFKGKMDAVIQLADGHWEVIDYKTYGASKYATQWDACDQNFQKVLEPLPDDADLSHAERFVGQMSAAYPVDYQLPLYYLACRQDPLFQGQLEGVSLQLVRPQFPKNANQGAIRLGISATDLEAKRTQLVADIQQYVVNPILGSPVFQADPASGDACGYCAYAAICEGSQSDALTEDGE